jgi:hypothetical protein
MEPLAGAVGVGAQEAEAEAAVAAEGISDHSSKSNLCLDRDFPQIKPAIFFVFD